MSDVPAPFPGRCGHMRQSGLKGKPLPCATPGCPDGISSPVFFHPRVPSTPPLGWRDSIDRSPGALRGELIRYERVRLHGVLHYAWMETP